MNDELYRILQKLLTLNDIKVNSAELKLQLYSHPSYPSLYSVTSVLEHFSIPNLALRLVLSPEILEQLPATFITNAKNQQGEQLILVEKNKKGIWLTFGNQPRKPITQEDFLKLSNGVILVIEKQEGIPQSKSNSFTQFTNGLFVLAGLIALTSIFLFLPGLFAKSHFILSIIGLLISLLIVKHELGSLSGVTKNICQFSPKTSCDAVLNSKGAQLFGVLKLSDISLIVFATYCLSWAISLLLGMAYFTLPALLSLLGLPFLLYSIYYQFRVIKIWCPLCLGIAGVLFGQALASLFINFPSSITAIGLQEISIVLLTLLGTAGIWNYLKSLLKKEQRLNDLQVEHYTFKRNFSFFEMLYLRATPLANSKTIPGELIFGNPAASIELLLLTSPHCFFCKETHQVIHQLLKKFPERLKLTIRFKVDLNDKPYELYGITTRLLEIYHSQGPELALTALDEIYGNNVNLSDWLENQPRTKSKAHDLILNEQYKWSNDNAVHFTPAFFINNRPFPKEYKKSDLAYFIAELEELIQSSQSPAIAS